MANYYIQTDEGGVVVAQSSDLALSPEEIAGGGWQAIPASIEGEIIREGVPLYKVKAGKVTARAAAEIAADTLEAVVKPLIAARIAESKAALAAYLEQNPLASAAHGGKAARYSVTADKQALLTSEMLMAQGAAVAGIPYALKWNAAGQPCEDWTLPELQQLAFEIAAYVKPLVAIQQGVEVALSSCTTAEAVAAVVIEYGAGNGGGV